ncbi:GDP-mannose pyrophosphatase NudK [Chryseosolibacter indicus]|uniref:GDP-mannose pyrophosphatase n=1 Tax=Chryseosolibacter indicus TaxID=2782351 RepID=A0ABS5VPK0_9BACT|nr:GDP-mannose pyrophosphatase NudK [Chryseosolibacter indicus]MBT1702779.1 GDP-mannose pyrophosphatase NudK [Chryseosolibacter indicus]
MADVKIVEKKLLSDNWYKLYKYTFEIKDKKGNTQTQSREAYDRGNGATILLYNVQQKTVVLTKQFRLPSFVNGNADGMMIEAIAGLLDEDSPEECIKRETEEETGYRISRVEKIYEAYMSPGSVTEILYFFIGEYTKDQKVNEGGGVDEGEDIEVLEVKADDAFKMIATGEIRDAKTIMLLQYIKLKGIL